MAGIRVEQLPNLDEVAREVVDAAVTGVKRGLVLMQGEAARIVRAERFATGHLIQSLHTEIMPPEGGNIVGTLSAEAPYAPFVEYDTRPHIAPLSAFDAWATAKGFRATGKSSKRGTKKHSALARAGWVAVKKRGTKGIHFMQRTYEGKIEEAKAQVDKAVKGALDKYAR